MRAVAALLLTLAALLAAGDEVVFTACGSDAECTSIVVSFGGSESD